MTHILHTTTAATDCDALEAMYKRVLALNSSHVATLQHYGNLLMRLRKNFTGAELMYERVLASVPGRTSQKCETYEKYEKYEK